MEIRNIGQIGIPVKNLERATLFYQNSLGLPLIFNTDTMAFFSCGDQRLMLTLPEKEDFESHSSILYFSVDDIHTSYEKMKSEEVIFIDEPHLIAKMDHTETWMVFFHDTEGNIQALMSELST
ncbi:VOC family protein [Halobacillus mangrovi]|uniref:Glyoxalase n=1 Tax=Halobacillus mangrovi TaxID=402384 RepID=A0A1W5ZR23_9BACI|nr:VOC family protein [Halobacillus mangrovi]ARI75736.1 glyoxalase [Halobacillus mangrovi]